MTSCQMLALRRPCYSVDDQRDPIYVRTSRDGDNGLIVILTVEIDLDGSGFLPPMVGLMAWHASCSARDCHAFPDAAGVPQDAPPIPTVAWSNSEQSNAEAGLQDLLAGVGGDRQYWFRSHCTLHVWRSLNGLERELAAGRLD